MKRNRIIGISMLVLAALNVGSASALTGAPITKFELPNKLGSAQRDPAHAACTGKNLRDTCSFSSAAQPSKITPPASSIRDPQDVNKVIGITSATIVQATAPQAADQNKPSQVSGECAIDPVDEVGGDAGLKCVAPTSLKNPLVKSSVDQKIITSGGLIRNDKGQIIGGTAEGLSPIKGPLRTVSPSKVPAEKASPS